MSLIHRRAARGDMYHKALVLVILFSLFFIPICAAAENFTITPTVLTISAVQGDTETRTFLILKNSPETTTNDIRIVPLDLNRADYQKVIPASSIEPGTPVSMTPPNGITIPVRFHFNTSESGEYTGNLLVNSNASTALLPVLVKLKADWPLPVLVLAFFTFFSVVFYDYATKGQKLDRLKVKIYSINGRLPNEFPAESLRYTAHFRDKIRTPLDEAIIKLAQNDYEGAEKDYTTAEAVWTHWISFCDQWKARLKESGEIDKKTGELIREIRADLKDEYPPEGLTLKNALDTDLLAAWEDASGTDTKPETTRAALAELDTRRVYFRKFYDPVQGTIIHLPKADDASCFRKLRNRMLSLNFAKNDPDTMAFANTFDAEFEKCRKLLPKHTIDSLPLISPELYDIISRITHPAVEKMARVHEKEPSIWQKIWQTIVQGIGKILPLTPSQRLWLYEILHSVFLPALILFFLGYQQLYGSNPTFGVNGIGDYFTLIIWGFATGTASEPIAQMIKDRTPAKT
jgi:hypothetical protein